MLEEELNPGKALVWLPDQPHHGADTAEAETLCSSPPCLQAAQVFAHSTWVSTAHRLQGGRSHQPHPLDTSPTSSHLCQVMFLISFPFCCPWRKS